MHIPDGFLDVQTATAAWLVAGGGIALAARRVRLSVAPRRIPLLGMTAAVVFAAQMLNFPVAAGTSGHLLGGVLAGVLLGPSAGLVVITSVLCIQCLLFADGGVLALGANIVNMGLVGTVIAYGIYALVRRSMRGIRGQLVAAAFAGWCSVVLAAAMCAVELALSGAARWSTVMTAMLGVHMLIGVGEAVITALVLAAIAKARPELLSPAAATAYQRTAALLCAGVVLAISLSLFAAPFASSLPDGLEHVAEQLGFAVRAADQPLIPTAAPDYHLPGIRSAAMATGLAGACGTLVMFAVAWVTGRLLTRHHQSACGTTS